MHSSTVRLNDRNLSVGNSLQNYKEHQYELGIHPPNSLITAECVAFNERLMHISKIDM